MFEEMGDAELCAAILEWADTEEAFDPAYVQSIEKWLEEKGSITVNQRRCARAHRRALGSVRGGRMRIGLTSDTHIGITSRVAIERMFAEMARGEPDIVVHAGDYCGTGVGFGCVRETVEIMRSFFPQTTILTTIGNHDLWADIYPSEEEFDLNRKKVVEIFRENDVHFLDHDGPRYFIRGDGTFMFMGQMGWYHTFQDTNDYVHMPVESRFNTTASAKGVWRRMLTIADTLLMDKVRCLEELPATRIFVSHMPVIEPGPWGWDPAHGEMLRRHGFTHFLNGHTHQLHEGPLRYESGSDYRLPRQILLEV